MAPNSRIGLDACTLRVCIAAMTAGSLIGGEAAMFSRSVRRRQGWPEISGKDGDPDHDADGAVRTTVGLLCGDGVQQLPALGGLGQKIGDRGDQQFAAERQFDGAMTVGQKAEVADALEARWQDVKKKTADEFAGVNRHDFGVLSVFVFVVLPLESDLAIFVGEQSLVGYGDAVRVAAQIFDGLLRTAKRRLRIHDPVGPA